MRVMINIDGDTMVLQIYNICDCGNDTLLITIIPDGTAILVKDVFEPANILKRITVYGWADLSKFPADYLTESTDDYFSDTEDTEREIDLYELER